MPLVTKSAPTNGHITCMNRTSSVDLQKAWFFFSVPPPACAFSPLVYITDFSESLRQLSYMRMEPATGPPTFLSTQSKCEMLDDEEVAGFRFQQRRAKQELKYDYGSWKKAPLEEQVKVQNLYVDYRAAEARAYRKVSFHNYHSLGADRSVPQIRDSTISGSTELFPLSATRSSQSFRPSTSNNKSTHFQQRANPSATTSS